MNLGHVKLRQKSHINGALRTQDNNKIQQQKQICEYVLQLKQDRSKQQKGLALRKLIELCYSNWTNQFFLCNNLSIPFSDGPVALTKVPKTFASRSNQVITLFKYLQKIKESYICWMIYLDSDLGVLNLKLLTQFELNEVRDEFQTEEIIIGVFIGKKYYSKSRTLSTKTEFYKCQSNFGLSSKTTKDSLQKTSKQKSNKNLKSVSMKQKRLTKNDFGVKGLDSTMTHKSKNHHDSHNKSSSSLKSSLKVESKAKK